MALKDGITLITGATSGIGRATALSLAIAWPEAEIWVTGRRQERLDELVRELGPRRARGFAFDVRDREAVARFADETRADHARLRVLINNAGLAAGLDQFQDASLDDFEQMIDTNIKGVLYLTRALLPAMIANGEGHVVNIGSIAGRYTYPKGHVYNATKFAVHAFGEALRLDLVGKNIRVSTIAPGKTETEFSVVRFKGDEARAHAEYAGMNPLTAEDVAEALLWVLGRPAHVNIQEVVLYPTSQASPRDVART